MLLTINIENTNLLVGCFSGEELLFFSRMAADRKKTADEYAVTFQSVLMIHGISIKDIDGSIVSSVVPAIVSQVLEAVRICTGISPLVVGPGVKTGLNILTENPAAVGTDQVCQAAAAIAEYSAPLIVISLETATTFLAVDERKNFVGSVIAPGVVTAAAALAEACDQLPRITVARPKETIGRNTVDSMKSGAVIGTAAMLDGMIERMEESLGKGCAVIATGSLAPVILPCCQREIRYDETLLLRGLKIIYEKNMKRSPKPREKA